MCIQLTWNVEYLPPNKCVKFHSEEIQYLVMYYILSIRPEAFQKFYTVLSSVDNLRLAGGESTSRCLSYSPLALTCIYSQ